MYLNFEDNFSFEKNTDNLKDDPINLAGNGGHFENKDGGTNLTVQTLLTPEIILDEAMLHGEGGDKWAERASEKMEGRKEREGRKESLVQRAAEVLGLEDKLAGEESSVLNHPLTLAALYLLATLHHILGIDLSVALSAIILVICMVCLVFK